MVPHQWWFISMIGIYREGSEVIGVPLYCAVRINWAELNAV